MKPVRIFVSSVTADLGPSARDMLRSALTGPHVEVKVQEDFVQVGLDTLGLLDTYLASCDAVIHVLGPRPGAAPPDASVQALRARHPDLLTRCPGLEAALADGPVSYTQWEAWLALLHGKRLFLAELHGALRPPAPEIDPRSQAAHRARLVALDYHPVAVTELQQLRAEFLSFLQHARHPTPAGAGLRVHVIATPADQDDVHDLIRQRRERGDRRVDWIHENGPAGAALTDAERASIEAADLVLVAWSSRANLDDHVHAALDYATTVAEARGLGEGFFKGKSLDGTPLPTHVEAGFVCPSPLVVAVLVGAIVALGVGVQRGWTVGLLPLGALLLVALLVAGFQALRRPDRLLRAARLEAAARFVATASVQELLAAAEGVLDRLMGRKLFSWRAFRFSALITLVTIVPVTVLFATYDPTGAQRGTAIGFALGGTVPLALTNVILDFVSLFVTRTVLRGLVGARSALLLGIGLVLDAGVVVLLGTGVLFGNLLMLGLLGMGAGSVWAWPRTALRHLGELLTGGIDLVNAVWDPFESLILVSLVAVGTATLPSVLHGGLLLGRFTNALTGQLPASLGAAVLRALARERRGPWPAVLLALALGLGGAAAVSEQPRWTDLPAPAALAAWEPIDPSRFATAAVVGCVEDEEPDCGSWETRRTLDPVPAPFALGRTEVTQAQWATVWDAAARAGLAPADRFGLPRHPSVFVGRDRPVESVSWCDAVRFANLWSLVDGVTPVYTVDGGSPALEGCGEPRPAGRVVHRNPEAGGYRLPTEWEWELAARGGTLTPWWTGPDEDALAGADWLIGNSDLMTHPVAAPHLRDDHPYGLRGVLGNVQEWTDSVFDSEDPADSGAWRVIRGGSFVGFAQIARSANRNWDRPSNRALLQGFRLVRASAPQP